MAGDLLNHIIIHQKPILPGNHKERGWGVGGGLTVRPLTIYGDVLASELFIPSSGHLLKTVIILRANGHDCSARPNKTLTLPHYTARYQQ